MTKNTSKNRKDNRGRVWTFVFYLDSAPENWQEVIQEWNVEAYVSPLHDKDTNGDGEPKKPHHHVVVVFSGNKSVEQVQELSDQLSKVHLVVEKNRVADKRITVRYLVHYDNPEKAEYPIEGILEFGGADKLAFFNGEKEDDQAVRDMMSWARSNECTSFSVLSDYAAKERPEWFRVLVSRRSYFMDKYLKALAFELRSWSYRPTQTHEKTCPACGSVDVKKKGKTTADQQRYVCKECGKSFV